MSRSHSHPVELAPEERQRLETLSRTGKAPASEILRARILLLTDREKPDGPWPDYQIAEALSTSARTISRTRERFAQKRLEALKREKAIRYKPRKLTGEQEARLVQIACSTPPKGHARWSLQMLADRLVSLDVVDSIAAETVRKTLKKTNSNRGKSNAG